MTVARGNGQTLAEKVLARASGSERVVPGQIIEGAVDLAMMHEQGAQTVAPYHQMGAERLSSALQTPPDAAPSLGVAVQAEPGRTDHGGYAGQRGRPRQTSRDDFADQRQRSIVGH